MHCRMRAIDRDLIREGHYGQRSCVPHSKAEHMAAPTNAANVQESSCQLGAVHTWHLADKATAPTFVRYWTKVDKVEFWPETVCPLMTQSGHRRPNLIGFQNWRRP